jgi:uncharacterized protein (DUF433 family)
MASRAATLEIAADRVPLEKWDDGSVRVTGTRLHYYVFLDIYLQGDTAEGLLEAFPFLDRGTVHQLLAYYHQHQDAVERWLAGVHGEIDVMREEHERLFPQAGLDERLRKRLAERNVTGPH